MGKLQHERSEEIYKAERTRWRLLSPYTLLEVTLNYLQTGLYQLFAFRLRDWERKGLWGTSLRLKFHLPGVPSPLSPSPEQSISCEWKQPIVSCSVGFGGTSPKRPFKSLRTSPLHPLLSGKNRSPHPIWVTQSVWDTGASSPALVEHQTKLPGRKQRCRVHISDCSPAQVLLWKQGLVQRRQITHPGKDHVFSPVHFKSYFQASKAQPETCFQKRKNHNRKEPQEVQSHKRLTNNPAGQAFLQRSARRDDNTLMSI